MCHEMSYRGSGIGISESSVTAVTQPGGKKVLWTPEYLTLSRDARRMLCADVEAEQDAIAQYKMHIRKISDEYVNVVLRRIIRDEEYHIMQMYKKAIIYGKLFVGEGCLYYGHASGTGRLF